MSHRVRPSPASARHVERAEAHDLTTDGVSDAAREIYTMPAADDRAALVRGDLIDTAKRAGLRCVALVIELASTPEHWEAVAADFRRAKMVGGSHRPGLAAAYEAAEALMRDDVNRALAYLANDCGLSAEEWLRVTRAEQGR